MDGRRQDQRPLRQGRLFSAHERSRQSRPPPVRQVDHGDRAAPVRNRQRGGLALLHSLHRRAHGDPRRPYSHAHVPLPDPDRLRGHRDRPRRDGDRPVAHGDPRQHPGILRAYGILGHSHGPRTTRRATRPQGGARPVQGHRAHADGHRLGSFRRTRPADGRPVGARPLRAPVAGPGRSPARPDVRREVVGDLRARGLRPPHAGFGGRIPQDRRSPAVVRRGDLPRRHPRIHPAGARRARRLSGRMDLLVPQPAFVGAQLGRRGQEDGRGSAALVGPRHRQLLHPLSPGHVVVPPLPVGDAHLPVAGVGVDLPGASRQFLLGRERRSPHLRRIQVRSGHHVHRQRRCLVVGDRRPGHRSHRRDIPGRLAVLGHTRRVRRAVDALASLHESDDLPVLRRRLPPLHRARADVRRGGSIPTPRAGANASAAAVGPQGRGLLRPRAAAGRLQRAGAARLQRSGAAEGAHERAAGPHAGKRRAAGPGRSRSRALGAHHGRPHRRLGIHQAFPQFPSFPRQPLRRRPERQQLGSPVRLHSRAGSRVVTGVADTAASLSVVRGAGRRILRRPGCRGDIRGRRGDLRRADLRGI